MSAKDKVNGFLDQCKARVMAKECVCNKGTNNEKPIAPMKEMD